MGGAPYNPAKEGREWALFRAFSAFNHKEQLCMLTATHCLQSCWSIGQTI